MLITFFEKIGGILPSKWQWILAHEGFRRYFKNTSWMFFGQMFSLLVSFFIGAWLARYLGPDNYGVLNYAMSFGGLFAFIAALGVDSILSRELIKFKEKQDRLLGTALILKLIGGAIAFSLAVTCAFIFESAWLVRFLIILFSLTFILQAIGVVANYFYANVLAKSVVKTQFISMLISAVLKVVAILSGLGVIWIMAIYVLEALWYGIGLIFAYGKRIRLWQFDRGLARLVLRDAWPLMLSGAATFIYMKIDQVMIGQMLNKQGVGIYAAAIKIAEIWYFIPGIICSSLFPAIMNARATNLLVYRSRLRRLYLLMIFLAIIIALPISFFAKPIISIIFGVAYLPAAAILQIYIWSGLGIFLSAAVTQYLLAENRTQTIFITSVLAMMANIILNLILIPMIGLSGAAMASLISYIATPLLILIFVRKKYD